MSEELSIDYSYQSAEPSHTCEYLWQPIEELLLKRGKSQPIFELGCGNGAFARRLDDLGFRITAVDPSAEGVARARGMRPVGCSGEAIFSEGNAYEPLAEKYGQYSCLLSLEVVEHVYYPRKYARCVNDLLEPGGIAIVSTPYHSYLKNLALSLSGSMEAHFSPLWDHGHIKFWSVKTLTELFVEQGMTCEKVVRVGRFPMLAKSMILVLRKP